MAVWRVWTGGGGGSPGMGQSIDRRLPWCGRTQTIVQSAAKHAMLSGHVTRPRAWGKEQEGRQSGAECNGRDE